MQKWSAKCSKSSKVQEHKYGKTISLLRNAYVTLRTSVHALVIKDGILQ